jgi:hypothetical protein
MGAAASVEVQEQDDNRGIDGVPASKIDEARAYFANEILMKGFWAPIDTDGG